MHLVKRLLVFFAATLGLLGLVSLANRASRQNQELERVDLSGRRQEPREVARNYSTNGAMAKSEFGADNIRETALKNQRDRLGSAPNLYPMLIQLMQSGRPNAHANVIEAVNMCRGAIMNVWEGERAGVADSRTPTIAGLTPEGARQEIRRRCEPVFQDHRLAGPRPGDADAEAIARMASHPTEYTAHEWCSFYQGGRLGLDRFLMQLSDTRGGQAFEAKPWGGLQSKAEWEMASTYAIVYLAPEDRTGASLSLTQLSVCASSGECDGDSKSAVWKGLVKLTPGIDPARQPVIEAVSRQVASAVAAGNCAAFRD
ncbi:hypothetical protein [Inhella gelatinilytica]|uniref:Uncharacterized protein n=1 Tax=Inhella gelatinilytica TaxID=2795030 RepID=A0A931IUX8_9BURK|nr:hypothetical protein [Inhella gelatinilytica]MBH9552011.1 hypothetical protein [Inhella gelatinilytica]